MSETRAPYDAGEVGPKLETVITQVMNFPDGSRIRILIDSYATGDDETDQATEAYYLHLLDRLNLIEQLRQPPGAGAETSTAAQTLARNDEERAAGVEEIIIHQDHLVGLAARLLLLVKARGFSPIGKKATPHGGPMKRIYFDIDHPAALAAWLQQRPAGPCTVLIGSDQPEADGAGVVLASLGGDRNLGMWLLTKIQAGELQVKMSAKLAGMPEGVEL